MAERTSDEHALLLTQLLDLDGLDIDDAVTGIAVTSSVPLVTANLRQMVARWFDVPAVVLEPGVKSGMPILYDNPKEVGADRIANAVGAHDLFGGPCVVVDLGTATTFDAISAAGEYLGGAITPGVAISLDALFANAAALGRVELVEPRSVIGKSTVESIQSGRPLRLRRPGRRAVPPVRRRAGRVHGGGHRGTVRAHLPLLRGDRVRGAVAHPPRPADHLRAEFTPAVLAVGVAVAVRRPATVEARSGDRRPPSSRWDGLRPALRGRAGAHGRVADGPRGRRPGSTPTPVPAHADATCWQLL